MEAAEDTQLDTQFGAASVQAASLASSLASSQADEEHEAADAAEPPAVGAAASDMLVASAEAAPTGEAAQAAASAEAAPTAEAADAAEPPAVGAAASDMLAPSAQAAASAEAAPTADADAPTAEASPKISTVNGFSSVCTRTQAPPLSCSSCRTPEPPFPMMRPAARSGTSMLLPRRDATSSAAAFVSEGTPVI